MINPFVYEVKLKKNGGNNIFNGEQWILNNNEQRQLLSKLVTYSVKGGEKPNFSDFRYLNFSKYKLKSEARPTHWTLLSVIGWSGLLISVLSICLIMVDTISVVEEDISSVSMSHSDLSVYFFLLLGIGGLIIAIVKSFQREVLDVLPKQSIRTPRKEFQIDSWHVSVPGAGEQFEQFKQRLYGAIKTKEPNIEIGIELHQRFTPRGYEERERFVLAKGQTTLHVHIYPFATDAFVGWESYINWNRWVETEPIFTNVKNGKKVNYRSLRVGVHTPTDFDLIEADVLAETTHRIIVDEIKSFLKEKEIEAELDFKIIRGDRANALKEGKDEDKKKGW